MTRRRLHRAGLGLILALSLLHSSEATADGPDWYTALPRPSSALPPPLLRVRLPENPTPLRDRPFQIAHSLQENRSAQWTGTLRKWLPMLLLAGVGIGLELGLDSPDEPRWTERNRFDDSVRSGLRITSDSGRKSAGTASSVLLATSGALLAGDWALSRDVYSPLESFRIDASWIFASGVTTIAVKYAAARERPFVHACERGLTRSGCDWDTANESFYSGHTSWGSTMAGLMCARRLHRPQRSVGDILWCSGASSIALATGFLRIASDEHWMTDTLTGWALGLVFGYLLPTYFHYGQPDSPVHRSSAPSHMVTPIAGRDMWGLRYQVIF